MYQQALIKSAHIASAKRGKRERGGVHAWHPYYAGYAESFVESAISYLELDSTSILLDPWNGSGTTNLVASHFDICSIGSDINPVMNIFASAKRALLATRRSECEGILMKILDSARETKERVPTNDPLLEFMSIEFASIVRTVYAVIESTTFPKIEHVTPLKKFVLKKGVPVNSFQALIKAALFIVARRIAGYKPGSNPTWIKSSADKPDVSWKNFTDEYTAQLCSMLDDIATAAYSKKMDVPSLILEADSRDLPIPTSSIDGVITSPPYLTRIDYAISVKPELLIMMLPEHLREIREKTIGAPVIVDKDIAVSDTWGTLCCDILRRVSKHQTKAARSYYLPNMLQYFRDMERSLSEIIRVLKPGASALIVVQSSFFKEIEIPLGNIYVQLISNLGARSEIAAREYVRGHLAHVNTRSNGYHDSKVYYEDVVRLEKSHD